jgi:endonuclease/exonuclease/phosphatase (EEP) superfamily protein YafD
LRNFLFVIAVIAATVTVFGFLGSFNRAADSLSLLRPICGAVALLGIFTARSTRMRIVFAALSVGALFTVGHNYAPQSAGNDIRIYSKNLWYENTQIKALAVDILQAQVDAVFLQEVSDKNASILAEIRKDFPYQHLCRFSPRNGIAIASRIPFIGPQRCSTYRGAAAAMVTIDQRDIWLVSTHVPWPWPLDSATNDQAVLDLLNTLDGPKVIVGDFNIFPWSYRIQKIAQVTDTHLAGPTQATFSVNRIPLPIDHALAPGGGQIATRPLLGSDHLGILADLSLTPK